MSTEITKRRTLNMQPAWTPVFRLVSEFFEWGKTYAFAESAINVVVEISKRSQHQIEFYGDFYIVDYDYELPEGEGKLGNLFMSVRKITSGVARATQGVAEAYAFGEKRVVETILFEISYNGRSFTALYPPRHIGDALFLLLNRDLVQKVVDAIGTPQIRSNVYRLLNLEDGVVKRVNDQVQEYRQENEERGFYANVYAGFGVGAGAVAELGMYEFYNRDFERTEHYYVVVLRDRTGEHRYHTESEDGAKLLVSTFATGRELEEYARALSELQHYLRLAVPAFFESWES